MPSKRLTKLLPQGDLISEAAQSGLGGLSAQYDISSEQLSALYQEGSTNGPGSPAEFRMIVAQYLTSELEARRDELVLSEWLDRLAEVNAYLQNNGQGLVASSEVALDTTDEEEEIPKFRSGFAPLDDVLGGLYQGILTLMAKSGHGKTSFMLTLMEALRKSNAASEIWFFETEIPARLMMYRMRSARRRVKFGHKDLLICGATTSADILRRVVEKPNPERVIFVDSPDVMAGGLGESKRFGIEAIYRDLVAVKERSKLVVVASQVRRRDRLNLSMESVAEAWTKVHYSDMLIGASKLGRIVRNLQQVRFSVSKNRFGVADQEVTFGYNYADLSWENSSEKPRSLNNSEDDW